MPLSRVELWFAFVESSVYVDLSPFATIKVHFSFLSLFSFLHDSFVIIANDYGAAYEGCINHSDRPNEHVTDPVSATTYFPTSSSVSINFDRVCSVHRAL